MSKTKRLTPGINIGHRKKRGIKLWLTGTKDNAVYLDPEMARKVAKYLLLFSGDYK